jgi:hypothetical protein
MISAWTRHLPQDQIEGFQNKILGSKEVLARLQALLNEMKEDADNLELSTKIYDLPNWEHRQADLNGYKRCIKQISKLLNLDQG